jgi:hypothetical protein
LAGEIPIVVSYEAMSDHVARPSTSPAPTPREIAILRAMIAEGLNPEEIAERTGWSDEKVRDVRTTLYVEEERDVCGRRPEEVFVDYVVRSRGHIRELSDLVAEARRDPGQASAVVGAIKAKQGILDAIIKRGQELGFIDQRPEVKGIILAKLDDRALVEVLSREVEGVRGLMARYGSTPFIEVTSSTAATGEAPLRGPAACATPSRPRALSAPGPSRPVASKSEFAPPKAPPPSAPPGPEGSGQVVRRKAVARVGGSV